MPRTPTALLAVLMAAAGLAAPPASAGEDGWRVVYQRGGVSVFSRKVDFSQIEEVRAVGVMEFPAAAILAVLADVEAYPGMIPPTVVARRLQTTAEASWYYMELKPSMVARRFYCMRVQQSRLPGGVLRSEWSTANQLCPARQAGLVRMDDNAGSWTLTPLASGRTRVTFQSHADPAGAIPAWIVNQVTVRALPDTLDALKRAVLRARPAQSASK